MKRVNPKNTPTVISLKCISGKKMSLGNVILQCLKNDYVVIEGNGDAEGEGFHNSEG